MCHRVQISTHYDGWLNSGTQLISGLHCDPSLFNEKQSNCIYLFKWCSKYTQRNGSLMLHSWWWLCWMSARLGFVRRLNVTFSFKIVLCIIWNFVEIWTICFRNANIRWFQIVSECFTNTRQQNEHLPQRQPNASSYLLKAIQNEWEEKISRCKGQIYLTHYLSIGKIK